MINNLIEKLEKEVSIIMAGDISGHGMSHIKRVLEMSLKFCESEKCNKEVVALIAMLHDVDDYKFVGKENAEKLTNAKKIMNKLDIDRNSQEKVINALSRFGYSKSLKGIRPESIEGKIVSDADMCDASGVNGVIRTFKYSTKENRPFFDRNKYPIIDIEYNEYSNRTSDSTVCHIFEKILKLKNMMFTKVAYKEAERRERVVIEMLYELFEEENAPEWKKLLDDFIKTHK